MVRSPTASLTDSGAAGGRLRTDARAILDAVLRDCDAGRLLELALADARSLLSIHQHFIVIAAGKAAPAMARTFAAAHRDGLDSLLIAASGHPAPTTASVEAGQRAMDLARAARAAGKCLVVLLSGGASSMLALPATGISLDDKIRTTERLLQSGLPIAEMNVVRKHLSAIKGGQLAAAAADSITFAVSDVHAPIENDPAVIGSGPTVADPTTFMDAERALRDAGLVDRMPAAVLKHLAEGARGRVPETIKPGDERLQHARFVLAGGRREGMAAAAAAARARGYAVELVDRPIIGEARDSARAFVKNAERYVRRTGGPICIIGGGETTVTLGSGATGRGGRNQEFVLAASGVLERLGTCVLVSAGTDGIDGKTDAAGAIADPTTMVRAAALGLDADRALDSHDSYPLFQRLGDLIVTGPTTTNIGDLQLLLITPDSNG